MGTNGKLIEKALGITSRAICMEIKGRIRKINEKHRLLPQLTIARVMSESKNSVSTFNSWRAEKRKPRDESLVRIDSVLSDYEHGLRY